MSACDALPLAVAFFAGAFVGLVAEHLLRRLLGRALRERT